MTHEQAAFAAAQNRHHQYMGFGKKQRYIEVFQCSGEDMNNVINSLQPTTLSLAAQALAGSGAPGSAVINNGNGILGGANPSVIAAGAVKPSNPSGGLLQQGMLNSLQSQTSALITNGLVGNQLPTFPNSQPPTSNPPPTNPSSALDQYNDLQNNGLFLNPQHLALLGPNASALNSQIGMNNYALPPPSQSPAAIAALAAAQAPLKPEQTTPTSLSLSSQQSNGGIPGLLPGIRPPINAATSNDAASQAMINSLIANGMPVSTPQSLLPFGVPGLSATNLQAGSQSLLGLGSVAQFQNNRGLQIPQAGLGSFGGLLLPPAPTSNSPLLGFPTAVAASNIPTGLEFAYGNQQNQTSLLQSQLAAQRLLLSQSLPNANAGLLPTVSLEHSASNIGVAPISTAPIYTSNTGKRSFEQAFNASPDIAAAVAHAAQSAKRASYSYSSSASQPTISAGPTTYSHAQQPSTKDT